MREKLYLYQFKNKYKKFFDKYKLFYNSSCQDKKKDGILSIMVFTNIIIQTELNKVILQNNYGYSCIEDVTQVELITGKQDMNLIDFVTDNRIYTFTILKSCNEKYNVLYS